MYIFYKLLMVFFYLFIYDLSLLFDLIEVFSDCYDKVGENCKNSFGLVYG